MSKHLNVKNGSVSFLLFCCLLTFGCATENCRLHEAEMKKKAIEKSTAENVVKVFKYDGSRQCGMGKTASVEEMRPELGNIKVYSSFKKNDGLMRIQLCGSPTGIANVYEIDKADLEKAIALGFREWTFD